MAYVWQAKPTDKFIAPVTGTNNTLTLDGCTTAETTAENTKEQIDKIAGIVGKSVDVLGMRRIKEEVVVNE